MSRGGTERGGGRGCQAGSALSSESDQRLHPVNQLHDHDLSWNQELGA